MKTFFILVAVVAAVVQGGPYSRDAEYAMVADGDGTFKLINVNEETAPEKFFDPLADTRFVLFTNQNRFAGQVLVQNDEDSILDSFFDASRPTRITIHGQNGNIDSDINTLLITNYLDSGDFNVIVVDWSLGAGDNYIATRNRVGPVGGSAAQMIRLLQSVSGLALTDLTIVGHGLGAHVAGFIGKNFSGQVGNIVALDASLTMFSIDQPEQRVNNEDALYVESIHTNTGTNGFDQPIGMASFYPNFGNRQPGCGLDVLGNCAHGRSVQFFAESLISDRHFWARQCQAYKDILLEDCTASGLDRKMGGEPVDNGARGIYWLATNSDTPFATGLA